MDDLVAFRKNGNFKDLSNLVKELDNHEILALVADVESCAEGYAETAEALLMALSGIPLLEITEELADMGLAVYKRILPRLRDGDIPPSLSKELLKIAVIAIKCLNGKGLGEIADLFMDWSKLDEIPEVLVAIMPSLIVRLTHAPHVIYDERKMLGSKCRERMIRSLCQLEWDAINVPKMVKIFREIENLTGEELQLCAKRALRIFHELPLDDLPAVFDEILLLACEKGDPKFIVDGMISFFRERDSCAMKSSNGENLVKVREVAGNVILRICDAAQYNSNVARVVMDSLEVSGRNAPQLFSPFGLALAFSLNDVLDCKELMEYIQKSALQILKDDEFRSKSSWLRKVDPETIEIRYPLIQTAQYCLSGWESAFVALTDFAFGMMETSSKRMKLVELTSGSIGADVFVILFKAKESSRKILIEKLLKRVMTGEIHLNRYLDIAKILFRDYPLQMQTLHETIGSLMHSWPNQPYIIGYNLFASTSPLLKTVDAFRQDMLSVLRDAMLNRLPQIRTLATSVCLMILNSLRFSISGEKVHLTDNFSQQASPSVNEMSDAAKGALCHEIVLIFRGCIEKNLVPKKRLYQGLANVFQNNRGLARDISRILHQQLLTFISVEAEAVTVSFEKCFEVTWGQVAVADPLNILVRCAGQCAGVSSIRHMESSQISRGSKVQETSKSNLNISALLGAFIEKLVEADPSDFGLDIERCLDATGMIAAKMHATVDILCGCYEASIEHLFTNPDWNNMELAERIIRLFRKCHKLRADFLRQKKVKKMGIKTSPDKDHSMERTLNTSDTAPLMPPPQSKKPAHFVERCSGFSLKFLNYAFQTLFMDTHPEHQEFIATLKANSDFVDTLYRDLLNEIDELKKWSGCETFEGLSLAELSTVICSLAGTMLQITLRSIREKKLGKKWFDTCLLAFTGINQLIFDHPNGFWKLGLVEECSDVIASTQSSRLSRLGLYSSQDPDEGNRNVACVLEAHLKCVGFLWKEKDIVPRKAARLIFDAAMNYLSLLPKESSEYKRFGTVLYSAMKKGGAKDGPTMRKLLIAVLSHSDHLDDEENTGKRQQRLLLLARKVVRVTNNEVEPDVDEDTVGNNEAPESITQDNASTVVLPVLSKHVKETLSRVEWVAGKLTLPSSSEDDKRREREVYAMLQSVLDILVILVDIEAPDVLFLQTLQKWNPKQNDLACTFVTEKLRRRLGGFHDFTYFPGAGESPQGSCTADKVVYERGSKAHSEGIPPKRLESLVQRVAVELTQKLHDLITGIHGKKQGKHGSAAAKRGASGSGTREYRPVTTLVFAVERYEGYLSKFSKIFDVDYVQYAKASTVRSFIMNREEMEENVEDDTEEESDFGDALDDSNDGVDTQKSSASISNAVVAPRKPNASYKNPVKKLKAR